MKRLCYCPAYHFPHRPFSGSCRGDPERGDEEAADRWLTRLMIRGYRNQDEMLNDNRRGQAAAINRERR